MSIIKDFKVRYKAKLVNKLELYADFVNRLYTNQCGQRTISIYCSFFTSKQSHPKTITGDFADDKALLAIYSEPEMASNLVQNHLNLLSVWYKIWGIKINEAKSIHFTFTLRQKVCPPIYLNNTPLPIIKNQLLRAEYFKSFYIIMK